MSQAAKDFSFLVTDPDDLSLDELVDAFLSRSAVWHLMQRSIKAKADFEEVRMAGPPIIVVCLLVLDLFVSVIVWQGMALRRRGKKMPKKEKKRGFLDQLQDVANASSSDAKDS